MDDKQVKLLQPLLEDLVKSGTQVLDVVQECKGKHYHVRIERAHGEAPEDDGSMKTVDRDGTQSIEA